eukprot:g32293.t1
MKVVVSENLAKKGWSGAKKTKRTTTALPVKMVGKRHPAVFSIKTFFLKNRPDQTPMPLGPWRTFCCPKRSLRMRPQKSKEQRSVELLRNNGRCKNCRNYREFCRCQEEGRKGGFSKVEPQPL